LEQYRFNLCPENSNASGYCTEKIFEAIYAGCIPVYYGANQQPELDVLNQNAILFIRLGENNDTAINHIKHLNEDKNAYLNFVHQPRFTEQAPEIIWDYFRKMEEKLREII
jgi:hypothetical protein